MCGIAGCYQQVDGDRLSRVMGGRLAHRGPDDEGLYGYEGGAVNVHLAHRRLSIIDLSDAAHQPFCRHGLALVYNGELYNYRALRSELSTLGARFSTSSDTEVVLEAWREWGPDAMRRFRGMFALAVFDERTGCLSLGRDPLGIKPLHYLPRKDGVVFASELKGILSAVGHELAMDHEAMVASMLFYWVPPQYCAIRGVEKLPPGSWAEFRPDGTSTVHTYWRIEDVAAEAAATPAPGPSELADVIQRAVEAHLVADVPVSSFLSGGLDSSIVTVLAQRADPAVDAYTITFRPEDHRLEAMPDDAVYARRLAARFGINLHEIEIAPDVVDLLPRTVDMLDEPIGDPAAINTFLMCEAARQAGIKVILSGMGADELFGGYRKHIACLLAARYRRLPGVVRGGTRRALEHAPVVAGGRGLRTMRWAKRFLTFAELDESQAFLRSYTLYDRDQLAGLLNPDLHPHVDAVLAGHDELYNDTTLDDVVNRMCLADTRLMLPGLNLAYTDRASMAASVEVRVPFVDPEVARIAFRLPGGTKVRGGKGKQVLKEAASAWLPPEITRRPKASFSAPLRAWVSRDLGPLIDEELVGGQLVASGFLDKTAVTRLVDEDRAGREDRSKQLWQLLTLELWSRNARAEGVAA